MLAVRGAHQRALDCMCCSRRVHFGLGCALRFSWTEGSTIDPPLTYVRMSRSYQLSATTLYLATKAAVALAF